MSSGMIRVGLTITSDRTSDPRTNSRNRQIEILRKISDEKVSVFDKARESKPEAIKVIKRLMNHFHGNTDGSYGFKRCFISRINAYLSF